MEKEKVYLTRDLGKIEWPFKDWTLYQLRKTCEYNKGISHACVDAFNNYSLCKRKADLIVHMEKQMNELLNQILVFHATNKDNPKFWNWDGYQFRYDTKLNAYQVVEVKIMGKCPKCGHLVDPIWKHCQFCLEPTKVPAPSDFVKKFQEIINKGTKDGKLDFDLMLKAIKEDK